MATVLQFPETPQEYVYTNGYNLATTGWKWVFGMPPEGQIQGNSCGAMPFRSTSLSGLSSAYSIRGEDTVFMSEWAQDRALLLHPGWNFQLSSYPPEPKGPTIDQLSSTRTWLEALSACWFSDLVLQDQTISSTVQRVSFAALSACGTPVPPLSQRPDYTDRRLLLSRVQDMFKDAAKMKCTIGEGFASYTEGQTLWYWYVDYGSPAYQETSRIDQMFLGREYQHFDPDRPIEIDVQFVGVFTSRLQIYSPETGMTLDEKYVLANISDKMGLRQRTGDHQFYRILNWGGDTAARQIATIAGHDWRPTPPEDGWADYSCGVVAAYAVVWPKYLQTDYQ